ncbi:putative F-box protein [Podospora aff. communis PSN243]|uniref:F-box protein n=1 Tax=Podospora aff. communis PSN243 TaxID=3040156 RepID=A0AAV9H291_9PEZI|nr:putative F-box protein [Podospora aff. communis PSN243]
MSDANPDLESFREQWRAEVRSRHPVSAQQQQPASSGPSTSVTSSSGVASAPRKPPLPPTKKAATAQDGDDEYVQPRSFDDAAVAQTVASAERVQAGGSSEPVSALDHYEKAVEREAAGKLGDSLSLYRKAFRMDDNVDQKYKNKHFPRPPPRPATQDKGKAIAAAAAVAVEPQTITDLISSFSGLTIEGAGPPVEGMPASPCPIATLPDEILVHILRDVAILDVGDFVRLAQVCRRLAYLVATEDRIWRRVCLGSEYGFGGMHYHFQKQVTWGPLTSEDLVREATEQDPEDPQIPQSLAQRNTLHASESTATTLDFYQSLYSTWNLMFRLRPRIRFNGCYISTVNYIRAGMHNPNSIAWGQPVHIVTYYRYLRFFRDGTVLSLLTTAEPTDVVHHLTREALAQHAGGAAPHLPSSVVASALRGRWRLAHAGDNPHASLSEVEGDLIVETEGVSKYIYRMDLALRSAGKGGTKNNKLIWRGFYSYNRLTDDWAEFAQKNSKPFFFSRVKSYGVRGQ